MECRRGLISSAFLCGSIHFRISLHPDNIGAQWCTCVNILLYLKTSNIPSNLRDMSFPQKWFNCFLYLRLLRNPLQCYIHTPSKCAVIPILMWGSRFRQTGQIFAVGVGWCLPALSNKMLDGLSRKVEWQRIWLSTLSIQPHWYWQKDTFNNVLTFLSDHDRDIVSMRRATQRFL